MKSRALNLAALALLVSLCGWTSAGVRPAAAQALDAGKPAAQIFSGTCSACHRSARGLVRSISPGSLPGFLRQHYTTGNEMAGVMAAYVLGNGGTQQVAEPPPKREPKQKAKSDAPDVTARTPEPKEQSKAARQKAAKKGQPEPAARETAVAREPEKEEKPDKVETAKPEPAAEPPTAEAEAAAAAVECKVEEPAKPGAAAEDDKPPRQPTSLLTLPGFPPPVPEPEPEPVATAAQPGCEPPATASASASAAPAEAAPKEEPKELPSAAPAAETEAPKPEPPRSAVTEAAATLDIMQEEVHAPRPARTAPQKKRAP